jgi:hypothetical protein
MLKTCQSRQPLFILFTTLLFAVGMPTPAVAGIVTTADIMGARQSENTREHLNKLLAREDVQEALTMRGVDVEAAQKRVDSMTDAEIQTLAANIDQLPAGGRLSRLEVLMLVIIVILLI